MADDSDFEFFRLRKESKTYISKVFSYSAQNTEKLRNIKMVLSGSDEVLLGEIDGAMCLRLTGNVRKTQVSAIVTQDANQIRRLSLQTFKTRAGDWIETTEKDEFTFRSDEFERLTKFLTQIEFVDLSNENNFQIEDISTQAGPKSIIDASDRMILDGIKLLSDVERRSLLQSLQGILSTEEINILLGRKKGLAEFESQLDAIGWNEANWQDFFDREQWVFGYGLDYRFMRQFDREVTVGGGGTDNKYKPVVDFLMSFTNYTVIVEIKRPDTPIFKPSRGGRAGTWEFSPEFMGAFSQIIEQKAEWQAFAQTGEHFNKAGNETLLARTRNTKSILVVGSSEEFSRTGNARDRNLMQDTFELFRRESRNIDIVTFDELLERARFIARN